MSAHEHVVRFLLEKGQFAAAVISFLTSQEYCEVDKKRAKVYGQTYGWVIVQLFVYKNLVGAFSYLVNAV